MTYQEHRTEMTEDEAWAALEKIGRGQQIQDRLSQNSIANPPKPLKNNSGENLQNSDSVTNPLVDTDPWNTGWADRQSKRGLPTRAASRPDFETRIEMLRTERNEWIERMALQMGKHRTCQGATCRGFIYQWYGPLNLSLPGVGFVTRPCSCDRGQMWGKQIEQEADHEEVRRVRYEILKNSGMPLKGVFEDKTLETFGRTPNGKSKWFEDFTRWYKDEWLSGQRKQGAIFMGTFGIGKTGVAIGMGRDVVDKLGVKVLYLNVADFVEGISRAWVAKDGSDYTFLDRMKNRELLILNDLGAGHGVAKDWDDKSPMQHLFNVLDYRNTMEYPYVITSNCQGPKALGEIVGERNLNRIMDTCKLFNCTGANLRNRN